MIHVPMIFVDRKLYIYNITNATFVKKTKLFKHFRGCIGKADPSIDQTDMIELKKFYAGSKNMIH